METFTDSDEPYTITVNNSVYALSDEYMESVATRARNEYSENEQFSCWWKIANQDDAKDSIHSVGDPILVIETTGVMVPWERLDQLQLDEDTDSYMGIDQSEDELGRTHFPVAPQEYEPVPDPEGENEDRVPQDPKELNDPSLVMWSPEHPDITHTWAAGRAIEVMYNWVEWNVQVRANQPRPNKGKETSHDHFESLMKMYECDKIDEVKDSVSDKPSTNDSNAVNTSNDSSQVKRRKSDFTSGKFGGNNWQI